MGAEEWRSNFWRIEVIRFFVLNKMEEVLACLYADGSDVLSREWKNW